MTAVVAIMNRSGMALAADSAVTVTNGVGGYSSSKIYNTANKLFMLSKYHPVGIMVYSSADFMQVPWELIIKLYRKHIDNMSFDTIEKYKDSFLDFILTSNQFSFMKKEADFLANRIFSIVSHIIARANKSLLSSIEIKDKLESLEGENFNDKYLEELEVEFDKIHEEYTNMYNKLENYYDYSFEDFIKEHSETIYKSFELCNSESEIDLNKYISVKNKLVSIVYKYLTNDNFQLGSTGIVFAGFGESEVYPALSSIEIDGMLNNKLRYVDDKVSQIDERNTACIVPFAQKDVMQMFIEGIDPKIEQVFKESFTKIIKGYSEILINNIDDDELKKAVQNIDTDILDTIFSEDILEAKKAWQILPTINTIEILSKEDLAEMAESLIYLTFLKRRTSSSQESVGGPIDVAIISKGDGFIWKNRKHYFEKELNQHFFSNYFNSYI